MNNLEKPVGIEQTSPNAPKSSEEKLQTIEQNIAMLKYRAERMRAEKEEQIGKKMVDRESLIAKSKEIDDLYQKVLQTYESLNPLREQDELKDDADLQKQIQEAGGLMSDLKTEQFQIQEEIAKIEKQPEVLNKVWDEAKEQDVEFEKGKKKEQLKQDMDKDVQEFVKKINESCKNYNEWFVRQAELEEKIKDAKVSITTIINEARKMFDVASVEMEVISAINYVRDANPEGIDRALAELREIRESLGVFSNRSVKRGLDSILSREEGYEAYKQAFEEKRAFLQTRPDIDIDNLTKEYRSLKNKYGSIGDPYSQIVETISKEQVGGTYRTPVGIFQEISKEGRSF